MAGTPLPGERPDEPEETTVFTRPAAVQRGDRNIQTNNFYAAPNPPMVAWPVVVGRPPALASAFQPRHGLRDQITAARGRGADVVLTHQSRGGSGTRVLAGGGGVGKSQLAAWFAHRTLERNTDLVVWVDAATADQVISSYARAAARVGLPGADGTDLTVDAQRFLEWLHTTPRSWLVVLDDVTDPAALTDWWPPHRPAGWTVATTRLRDDPTLVSAGRLQVDVDVYSPDESEAYLTDRLTDAGHPHLLDPDRKTEGQTTPAGGLAAALGHLPLALSHAAAYMLSQGEGCTTYLARYTHAESRLADLMPADAQPDGYPRAVALTLLLALDAADTADPPGLARPALALAAMLDPAGHPDTLWATPAVTGYLTAHRTGGTGQPVSADQARRAMRLLHRYGLLTHTPTDSAHAVRIHALTARAARETFPELAAVSHAAADALLALWPADDHTTSALTAALRANTTTLTAIAGDLLWQPDGHPLLYRAGTSLLDAGLHTTTVPYWQHMTDQATRLLGDDHPDTLTARANLAASYGQAGRTGEAISLGERLVADRTRLFGEEHPSTLTVRANLASSYRQAGRIGEAISLQERVVADRERLLGEEHPSTLTARGNLAVSYGLAGRIGEAISLEERVVADRERLLGDEHPSTLTARNNLASSYRQAGRTSEAISLSERLVANFTRLLGEEHPSTLTARGNLAASYGRAARTGEAISLLERLVADFTRLLGDEHPDTLGARNNLASLYGQAGLTGEAISLHEKVVVDRERLLGDEHPDTLGARNNLAVSYWLAGRTGEAISLEEQVVADFTRLLGDEHPHTVAAAAVLREWRGDADP